MKKIFLIILFSTFCYFIYAQNLYWAKGMGGTGADMGTGIKIDASGNVYTVGSFNGTVDFDPGPGISNLTSAGGEDIFISKLNASGDFVWAKRIGGTNNDYGFAIAVDALGNVYTTGEFYGKVDFDPGLRDFNLTAIGKEVFISKIDGSGNFVWAKGLKGTTWSWDGGTSIVVDASQNVYIVGYFSGTIDFDPGWGVNNLTSAGSWDIFILRLDIAGNFLYVKTIGGSGDDEVTSTAVDIFGNIYATGWFQYTVDFDPGAGVQNLVGDQPGDIFILKLDVSGNFVWAKSFGGISTDRALGICLGDDGNVFTTGTFGSTVDFDPGPSISNLNSGGGSDIFILKLNNSGDFVWAKGIGGYSSDQGNSIAVDIFGNIYTTGYFGQFSDFDPGPGVYNLTSAGYKDIYVLKLNNFGDFAWVANIGGVQDDEGKSIAVDALENVYTTGFFYGTADFDPGAGVSNLTSTKWQDAFVLKLGRYSNGIDMMEQYSALTCFPNPANSKIAIKFPLKGQQYFICDVTGRQVLSGYLSNETTTVDIDKLVPGLYFIKSGDVNTETFKFVKE